MPSFSLIAWSHGWCGGNHLAVASKKTFVWCLYSSGNFSNSSSAILYGVVTCGWSSILLVSFLIYLASIWHSMVFMSNLAVALHIVVSPGLMYLWPLRFMNLVLAASIVCRMTGSCLWSIHPLAQSICGWVDANQGYPSMILWSPRSDRKNLWLVLCFLVWIDRFI